MRKKTWTLDLHLPALVVSDLATCSRSFSQKRGWTTNVPPWSNFDNLHCRNFSITSLFGCYKEEVKASKICTFVHLYLPQVGGVEINLRDTTEVRSRCPWPSRRWASLSASACRRSGASSPSTGADLERRSPSSTSWGFHTRCKENETRTI